MSKGLLKKASAVIRSLIGECKRLTEKTQQHEAELAKHAAAKDLSFRLWKMGMFPAEDLEEKYAEFLERPLDEINNFEKTASYFKSAQFNMDLGSISDVEQPGDETAEERFLSRLLED